MATAATITAKLTLESGQFKKGMGAAGASANTLAGKLKALDGSVRNNSVVMAKFGEVIQNAEKKMSMFVTLPILGFFTLLIKKALDADTAMSKLGNESIARLNASLAQLGVKFLPLFIEMVDGLTALIDKFLAADPAMQKFITMLVILAAMAGPVITVIGWMIQLVSLVGSLSTAFSGMGAAGIAAGTGIGAALLPLLPIIVLIIASVGLAYMLWKNWDKLGVTIKQLAYILGYYLYSAIIKIKKAFLSIKWPTLPSWLKPGSPTPFEMGLRGISSAMDTLSGKSMPQLNMGMAMAEIGGGGVSNVTNNVRFQQATPAIDRRQVEDVLKKTTGIKR